MASETPYSGRAVTTIDQFVKPSIDQEDNTCPNDEEWCDGPDGDDLPCFECFDPGQDYNVGRSE
jgi:hypothetical protein